MDPVRSADEGGAPIVADDGDDAVVHVHVQPRAGRTEVVGRHGQAVRIRVAAPPVDGRATAAAAEALAAALGVRRAAVTLESGATSRLKRFRVAGLSAAEVRHRLGL
jgi:uncharacterized protein (TIGR00251 family)